MSDGIIIVSPTGEEYVKEDKNLDHKRALCNYLENENLTFSKYKSSSRDVLSLYLVGLNYLVIHKDCDSGFLYIGEELSREQVKWYLDNKIIFRDTPVSFKSLDLSSVSYYTAQVNSNELDRVIFSKRVFDTHKVKVLKKD